MKTLVKNILIILIAFSISGCSYRIVKWPLPEPEIEVVYVTKFIECPAPNKPVFTHFDNEFHIGHLKNMEILRQNLEFTLRYSDSLENTIGCYVAQTK